MVQTNGTTTSNYLRYFLEVHYVLLITCSSACSSACSSDERATTNCAVNLALVVCYFLSPWILLPPKFENIGYSRDIL